jgi:hypothetical protein
METANSIYIENIPRLEWGRNTENSFVRSSQLTLNSIGEDYNYDFLMGISGAAFRLHFHPDFCPSSVDSTTGFDVSKVLFKSLGYNCELHKIDDNNLEQINKLYQKIKSQIDNGKPIIAINLKFRTEWGIITGYLKNRPGILCRTYFDESEEYSLAEHAPWLSFFIREKKDSLDKNDLISNSLKIAVQLAKTDVFEDYYSGFNGFKKWIKTLGKYINTSKNIRFDKTEENWTLFNSLLDSRRSAANYIENYCDTINIETSRKIADNYKNEVRLLSDLKDKILPKIDTKTKDWTNDIIYKLVDCLTKVFEIEKKNIVLIENELKN